MSVATVCLWCGILLVTPMFLTLVNTLTAPGAFLLYATVSIAAFLFVWRAVPETPGVACGSGNPGPDLGRNRRSVAEGQQLVCS
jgi:hypothetical protein